MGIQGIPEEDGFAFQALCPGIVDKGGRGFPGICTVQLDVFGFVEQPDCFHAFFCKPGVAVAQVVVTDFEFRIHGIRIQLGKGWGVRVKKVNGLGKEIEDHLFV